MNRLVNPKPLALERAAKVFSFELAAMNRLAESAQTANGGKFDVRFDFFPSRHGEVVSFSANLPIKTLCQRCLELMTVNIQLDAKCVVISHEDELGAIPKELDVVMTGDRGLLDLNKMLEDEIILSLPLVPMHPPQNCKATLEFNLD